MSNQKLDQVAKAVIDKEAINEIEEETGVRYKMRERSKRQKKVKCCIHHQHFHNGRRAKPIPIPGFGGFQTQRTKKAFLVGAERKLRNAVRRAKERYLHDN